MIVAIGGPPGSGKTTAAELYASTYRAVLLSGGKLFREHAAEYGMDLLAFSAYAETHHEIDRRLDEIVLSAVRTLVLEGKEEVVVDGRIQAPLLARANVPAFTVLVTAPLEVRAKRVAEREGKSDRRAVEEILTRERSERERYRAIYGIDLEDESVYRLVLDSTHLRPEAIVKKIREGATAWAAS